MKKKINKVIRKFLARISDERFSLLVIEEIKRRMEHLSPQEALKFIFDLDSKLYQLEGQAAIRYGGGLHTKHRHIKYHDFFIENISEGNRILDVGCGNGALAADIADNADTVSIYAIDLSQDNIDLAIEQYGRRNITYVCGDALEDLPDTNFDVIVLSNVLEHIEERENFLRLLKDKYNPAVFLIRVPCYDRDWRVPLKEELGLDYMLDVTHYIEYRYEQFEDEMRKAELYIESAKVNWGEIWAVVKPINE